MAYRSDEPALAAARAEERDLAEVRREARHRRVRAALGVAASLTVLFSGVLLLGFRVHARRLACHEVNLVYEVGEGMAPPLATWRACTWR